MTDRKYQKVRLLGGPLAGKTRHVKPTTNLHTFSYDSEPRVWDTFDPPVRVTLVRIATYKRLDDATFQHVRTPTSLGDTDLEELP